MVAFVHDEETDVATLHDLYMGFPVNDSLLVCRRESARDAERIVARAPHWQRSRFERLAQSLSFKQFR